MVDQEFINIVNERFLEITDRFNEMRLSFNERGNFIYINLYINFRRGEINTSNISEFFTPNLIQEITENFEFIKDYFSLTTLDIEYIGFQKIEFQFYVKYRKTNSD